MIETLSTLDGERSEHFVRTSRGLKVRASQDAPPPPAVPADVSTRNSRSLVYRPLNHLSPSQFSICSSALANLTVCRLRQVRPASHPFAMAAAVRRPTAAKVSVPLQQDAVGCVGAPATHRFS